MAGGVFTEPILHALRASVRRRGNSGRRWVRGGAMEAQLDAARERSRPATSARMRRLAAGAGTGLNLTAWRRRGRDA